MNTDICKSLYSSRIYCFSERQPYTHKNFFCYGYQVAVVTLFWVQERKLDERYSARVCEMKSLTCSLLPPLNQIDCARKMTFSLKLSFLISIFLNLPFVSQPKIQGR